MSILKNSENARVCLFFKSQWGISPCYKDIEFKLFSSQESKVFSLLLMKEEQNRLIAHISAKNQIIVCFITFPSRLDFVYA